MNQNTTDQPPADAARERAFEEWFAEFHNCFRGHGEDTQDIARMAYEKANVSLAQSNDSLRSTVARLEGALSQYHDATLRLVEQWENEVGDETCDCRPEPENEGHICPYCFAQALLKSVLQPAQSTPPLAPTAMDWDERLPYVPEKKTSGLPAQSAAPKQEERPMCANCGKPATCLGRYETSEGPEQYACDECCGHGNEDGHCYPVLTTPPQEQKTGGSA